MDHINPDHLEVERLCPFRLSIDGHEIVLAGDLQAVPGIEENTGFGAFQSGRKLKHLAIKGGLVEIEPVDHLEAVLLEHGGMSVASFLGLVSLEVC